MRTTRSLPLLTALLTLLSCGGSAPADALAKLKAEKLEE